jgi:hypothetical protein
MKNRMLILMYLTLSFILGLLLPLVAIYWLFSGKFLIGYFVEKAIELEELNPKL